VLQAAINCATPPGCKVTISICLWQGQTRVLVRKTFETNSKHAVGKRLDSPLCHQDIGMINDVAIAPTLNSQRMTRQIPAAIRVNGDKLFPPGCCQTTESVSGPSKP
jgi:hypothetical protein